jgi:uncharacterized sulfatase
MRSEVRLPPGFRMFPQYLRDAGYYCANNSKEDYNVTKPGKVWDESGPNAHWNKRKDSQPFFAVFNHTITHESQIRNEIAPKDRIHDPAKVRIPAYHPDTPEVRRDWAQYYDRITMMDAEVAQRLNELEDAGLAEDTIVFFFSDHGSGMPRSKRWLYRSGLNVPMLVHFPPKWRHLAPHRYADGGTSDRLVSFVDLAPTMLSIAGIKPLEWMQGGAFAGKFAVDEPPYSFGFRARMDERYDLSRSVRDKRYNYIRNYMPHRDYAQSLAYMFETPTTRVWHRLFVDGKLNAVQSAFWLKKPPEELYDLETDTDEIHNLATSPEHADVLARLRQAHREWEYEIKDVSFLSEWHMHAASSGIDRRGRVILQQHSRRGMSPYEMGSDPTRYNFGAAFAAAEYASSLEPTSVPELVRMLDSKDSAVRYWAAIGLLAHEQAGGAASLAKLRSIAMSDESLDVCLIAAEALGRVGDEADVKAALEVLLDFAGHETDYYLRIAAWNALDAMDEKARPVLSELKKVSPKHTGVPSRCGEYIPRLKEKTLRDLE